MPKSPHATNPLVKEMNKTNDIFLSLQKDWKELWDLMNWASKKPDNGGYNMNELTSKVAAAENKMDQAKANRDHAMKKLQAQQKMLKEAEKAAKEGAQFGY